MLPFAMCVAACWLAGSAPAAYAGFAPTGLPLSEPMSEVREVVNAVDSAGNTTAVWQQNTNISKPEGEQIVARHLSVGGSLGPLLTLSEPGVESFQPAVAGAPSGAAFAAWRTGSFPNFSIAGRWINPDGSLGPLLTIVSPSGSEAPVGEHVVVAANGVATVAWFNQSSGERVELRRIGPEGTEQPQVDSSLSANTTFGAAALPSGATFLVAEAETQVVSAGGTPAAPLSASTSGVASSSQTGIAFNSHGEGIVAWRESLGEPFEVLARRIDAEGAPIGSQIVVEPETSHFITGDESAAADPNGHFLVGWGETDGGSEGHGFARAVASDGSLPEVAHAVSPGSTQDPLPLLAIDEQGTAIAAFSYLGHEAVNFTVIGQVLGLSAQPIGSVAQLSGGAAGTGPSVANDPGTGLASVTWTKPSGEQFIAMDTRYMEPPTCTGSEASAALGRPVSVSLSCTGLDVDAATLITPPAHGTLGAFNVASRSVQYTPAPGYGGSDSFVYAMENEGGASTAATVRIVVTPAPSSASRPLVMSAARESHRVWREGRKLAIFSRKRKRVPVGTTFSFELSEAAAVHFSFTRQVRGRRVRHRCVAPTRRNHRRPACKRTVTAGTLAFQGHAGTNHVGFDGRVSASKRLQPGKYTLVIQASSAAGGAGPARLSFTIVK